MKQEIAYRKRIKQPDFMMDVYIDPFNKRLRVDDYRGSCQKAATAAEELALKHQAEKLIVIARSEDFITFLEKGFRCEAVVERFFRGSSACFFTKYFAKERMISSHWLKEDDILKKIGTLTPTSVTTTLPEEYNLIKINQADAEELGAFYKKIFPVYPVPLFEPDYIRKAIKGGTIFLAYRYKGKIVSAASADIDRNNWNAELTDCATLPEHRTFGLLKNLLLKLEEELVAHEIFCAYSLARAQSFGMNAVLYQLGFRYRGRMPNNCYIYNDLEDMNMWAKELGLCLSD